MQDLSSSALIKNVKQNTKGQACGVAVVSKNHNRYVSS